VLYVGDYKPYNIEEWSNEIAAELEYRIIKFPIIIFHLLAYLGNILKYFKINFPMITFRLKNMTTDNIINFELEKKVAPTLPYTRSEGIKKTLDWMRNSSNKINA